MVIEIVIVMNVFGLDDWFEIGNVLYDYIYVFD